MAGYPRPPAGRWRSRAGRWRASQRAQFLRWFDLIGLQRHIKVLGIFARLCWRDGKTGYLARPAAHAATTCGKRRAPIRSWPQFARFVEQRLAPGLAGCQRAGTGVRRAHEGHAAGRRARRAHAAADRHLPEATAAGGRQAADRLASANAWRRRAFSDVVINLSWLGEQIAARTGRWSALRACASHYSREPWPALETGGGIFQALPLLGDGPVPAGQWRCVHRRRFRGAAIWPRTIWRSWCWCPIPPHHPQGDFWLDDGGRIAAEGGERLTYSGIAMLRPALFAGAEPGRFPLLPWLLQAREAGQAGRPAPRGPVAGCRHAGAAGASSTPDCGACEDDGQ